MKAFVFRLFITGMAVLGATSAYAAHLASCNPNNPIETPIREKLLIVTHTEDVFDPGHFAKAGADRVIREFEDQNLPTLFLTTLFYHERFNPNSWYTSKKLLEGTALKSESGEYPQEIETSDVTIIGGYFGNCHNTSIMETIEKYFRGGSSETLKIRLPMDAIYLGGGPGGISSSTTLQEFYLNQYHPRYSFWDEDLVILKKLRETHPEIFGRDEPYILSYMKYRMFYISPDSPHGEVFLYYLPEKGHFKLSDYTFDYWVNDRKLSSVGTGAKRVEFRFTTSP